MAEHLIVVQAVEGSSPFIHPHGASPHCRERSPIFRRREIRRHPVS